MPGVKRSFLGGLLIAVIFCIVITPVLFFIPEPVARLYTEDTAIREMAAALLGLAALFIFIDMLAVVTSFSLRAFKDTRFPFLVMAFAYWLVALPLGYWLGLSNPESTLYGPVGFWWAMIVGIAIAAILTSARLWVFFNRPLFVEPFPPARNEDSPDVVAM